MYIYIYIYIKFKPANLDLLKKIGSSNRSTEYKQTFVREHFHLSFKETGNKIRIFHWRKRHRTNARVRRNKSKRAGL